MNEIYTPKKNVAYVWTLNKGNDNKDVMTQEGKASSEIKHLINDGYRITRRKPIHEDIQDKSQEVAKSNDEDQNTLKNVSVEQLDVWFEQD